MNTKDWWESRINGKPLPPNYNPPQQYEQPQYPVQQQPYYPPQQYQQPYPPQQPQPQPYPPQYPPYPPQYSQQQYPPYPPQQQYPQYPPQQQQPMHLPDSAADVGRCPGCGSGNYMQMSSGGIATERGIVKVTRCYDCGYPLANQSGAGMKGISVPLAGETQKARQVPTTGWNPSVVDKSFV